MGDIHIHVKPTEASLPFSWTYREPALYLNWLVVDPMDIVRFKRTVDIGLNMVSNPFDWIEGQAIMALLPWWATIKERVCKFTWFAVINQTPFQSFNCQHEGLFLNNNIVYLTRIIPWLQYIETFSANTNRWWIWSDLFSYKSIWEAIWRSCFWRTTVKVRTKLS